MVSVSAVSAEGQVPLSRMIEYLYVPLTPPCFLNHGFNFIINQI